MSADKLTREELDEIMLCMRSGLRMDRQDQARIASHVRTIEAELAAKDAALVEARTVIAGFEKLGMNDDGETEPEADQSFFSVLVPTPLCRAARAWLEKHQ